MSSTYDEEKEKPCEKGACSPKKDICTPLINFLADSDIYLERFLQLDPMVGVVSFQVSLWDLPEVLVINDFLHP